VSKFRLVADIEFNAGDVAEANNWLAQALCLMVSVLDVGLDMPGRSRLFVRKIVPADGSRLPTKYEAAISAIAVL
jgi:hypothetical protein